jgi:hypothetical protein
MSTNTQPRQPSGTPVGGQFAGKANPEPDVHLDGGEPYESWLHRQGYWAGVTGLDDGAPSDPEAASIYSEAYAKGVANRPKVVEDGVAVPSTRRAQCNRCGLSTWASDFPGQGGIVPDVRGVPLCDQCADELDNMSG